MRARRLGILLALATLIVTAPAAAADDWLGEINRYREAAGVGDVVDNPLLDPAMERHIFYLQHDLQDGESPHTELLGRPGYSPTGALEAENSNIATGSPGVFSSGVVAIDSWWESPFHAIGMLRPGLASTHLALAADGSVAMLDVFSGLTTFAPAATPVLFPGPASVTNLTTYSGAEVPSPLSACGLPADRQYGLPLIALLPTPPAAGLSATLAGPAGTQSLCVVDADTFRSDATSQTILQQDDAVVLIPAAPLATGAYTATIAQPGSANVVWSFTESGIPAPTTPGPVPAPGAPGSSSPGSTGSSGSSGSTGKGKPSSPGKSKPSPGKSKPSPVTKQPSSPTVSVAAVAGRAGHAGLALRGRGTATVTVTASRRGHRVGHRIFHERAGRWRVALVLPRRLHGRRIAVTVRVSQHGHMTVLHRRVRL